MDFCCFLTCLPGILYSTLLAASLRPFPDWERVMSKKWCGLCAAILAMMLAGSALAAPIVNGKLTVPADPIVGIAATPGSDTSTLATIGTTGGANNYPSAEDPTKIIDNVVLFGTTNGNKYLNFQKNNSGFIVNLAANGPSSLTGFRLASGNDAPERDPMTVVIEGTNSPNATTALNSDWSPVYSGVTGLASNPGRNAYAGEVDFVPTTSGAFASYRVLFTTVRDTPSSANSFQVSEIDLIGSTVPEPASIGLIGLSGLALLRRRR
jgi:hypothetical protein